MNTKNLISHDLFLEWVLCQDDILIYLDKNTVIDKIDIIKYVRRYFLTLHRNGRIMIHVVIINYIWFHLEETDSIITVEQQEWMKVFFKLINKKEDKRSAREVLDALGDSILNETEYK
jgi:hypothetical protein